MKPRRPFSVTLFAWGVLIIVGWNLTRLGMAVAQWRFLMDLPHAPWLYQAFTGLIWAAFGVPLSWGLWHGHSWVVRFAPRFVVIYGLYYWLDRLWVANGTVTARNWPLPVAASLLFLAFTFWVMKRQKNRKFFTAQALRND